MKFSIGYYFFDENENPISYILDKNIDKIIVFKAEKVDGRRTQRIQIFYNCIGAIDLPK